MDPVRIDGAPQGERVCLEGRVRSTGSPPLSSPVTERACIAFETHGGLFKGETEQENAQDFVLEDETGQVWVRMVNYELELGELKGRSSQNILETDLEAVAARIHDLKAKLQGPKSEHLSVQAELRDWKAVATLLCAVRAHKNGKVHTGHTLEGQARFIEENKSALSRAEALRHTSWRYLERFDTILKEGDRARCTGVLTEERDPDAKPQGYRGFSTRRVLRAPRQGLLRVEADGSRATDALFADLEQKRLDAIRTEPKAESESGCLLFYVALAVLLFLVVNWIWF